jgi:hypothetical protein
LLGLGKRVALPFSLQDDDIQNRHVTMGGTTVTRVTGSARENGKVLWAKIVRRSCCWTLRAGKQPAQA